MWLGAIVTQGMGCCESTPEEDDQKTRLDRGEDQSDSGSVVEVRCCSVCLGSAVFFLPFVLLVFISLSLFCVTIFICVAQLDRRISRKEVPKDSNIGKGM